MAAGCFSNGGSTDGDFSAGFIIFRNGSRMRVRSPIKALLTGEMRKVSKIPAIEP